VLASWPERNRQLGRCGHRELPGMAVRKRKGRPGRGRPSPSSCPMPAGGRVLVELVRLVQRLAAHPILNRSHRPPGPTETSVTVRPSGGPVHALICFCNASRKALATERARKDVGRRARLQHCRAVRASSVPAWCQQKWLNAGSPISSVGYPDRQSALPRGRPAEYAESEPERRDRRQSGGCFYVPLTKMAQFAPVTLPGGHRHEETL
jgi:hypothetical protein